MKQKFLKLSVYPARLSSFPEIQENAVQSSLEISGNQTGIFLRMESVSSHNWFWFDLWFVSVRLSSLMNEQLFLLQNYEIH